MTGYGNLMTVNINETENNQIIQIHEENIAEHQKHWHKANEEASNSGIVINIIDMFNHSIMLIAAGAFAFFAHYADAFIYSSFLELLDTKMVDVENKESAENSINEFSQQK